MRLSFCLSSIASLIVAVSSPCSAHSQQLISIVREVNASSTSASEWKAFVQVAQFEGASYVSVAQVAALIGGTVKWYSVSKAVELSVRGHTVRFPYNSERVAIDGRPMRLERPSFKTGDGIWIPASFFSGQTFFRATGARLSWPAPAASPKPAIPNPAPSPVLRAGEGAKTARVASLSEKVAAALKRPAVHRIVIDPGHGGKDPGTMSAHGVEEKAINLLVAQDLAESLRARDYEVLMTRTDDSFIPLAERAKIANGHQADLFISIHCNASLSTKLRGFEVYFLSEGASDPHADAVARLENASLALEGKSAPSPRQVAAVLRSLVKTAYINESSALGSMVDRQLARHLSEPSLGVKQAAFYVLRGAEMPAILVETGFLTNSKDEKLLQNKRFRRNLTEALTVAVAGYDERKQKDRR